MINVLVADDHTVVREGIKRIIADSGDMAVGGEAASGPELLTKALTGTWDVVLMDLAMPGSAGLEVLQDLRRARPQLPILVLSMYPEDQYAVRAIMAGASGYVHKSSPPEQLIGAIRTVLGGRRYVTPEVAESLAAHVDSVSNKPPHKSLSNREYQVMCLLAKGQGVSDIARELGLSVKTVSTFRTRIINKLNVQHNAEITRYALEHGLIE